MDRTATTRAFSWESAPRLLLPGPRQDLRPRVRQASKGDGHQTLLAAPRPPCQREYERLIGSIRRECLDHAIVSGERLLHRYLTGYADYYYRGALILRWTQALQKPEERS